MTKTENKINSKLKFSAMHISIEYISYFCPRI
jgi:hypothetical protein